MAPLDTADIPPIYVSEPQYDDMGAILDRLDVSHSPVRDVDLSQVDEGIVMLNCSFSWRDEIDRSALVSFVEDGGTLVASDLTAPVVAQMSDASFGSGDWGDAVPAVVDDPELVELLGQERLTLDFDTALREPTALPQGAEPLLRAEDRDSVIAFQFSHGAGEVMYTVFHNHSQPSEVEDALLQVLLMVPIAESTNTTVTETYTSIVEPTDAGDTSDTQLLDDSGETTKVFQPGASGTDTDVYGHDETTTVVLRVDGSATESVERRLPPDDTVTLGRDDFRDVVDADYLKYVSGTHLELRKEEAGTSVVPPEVRDADSTNGTVLDGTDISDGAYHTLESGSSLSLADGRVTLTVDIE